MLTHGNTRYFAAFTKDVIRNFWGAFEDFEAQQAAETLANANLADAQSAAVYLMLSKLASFKNPEILRILPSLTQRKGDDYWPLDPPPAGLFLLGLHEDDVIRSWSRTILLKGTVSSLDNFTANHEAILGIVMDKLSPGDQKDPPTKLVKELLATFPFASAPDNIWSLLSVIIRIAPAEVIQSMKVHRLVFAHLHDDGPRMSLSFYLVDWVVHFSFRVLGHSPMFDTMPATAWEQKNMGRREPGVSPSCLRFYQR